MKYQFLLLVIFALFTQSLAQSYVYSCPACLKKNTTLPTVPIIPGDGYCPAIVDETAILVQLYNALGGPNWIQKTNWLTGNKCDWYGITCNQNGNVVTIDLHSNNLIGNQLPPQIGCLVYLQGLVLDNNAISGQIPLSFCSLQNIQYLTLSYNNLGGGIPSCFSKLKFLIHFYVQYNGLVGELPDFSLYHNIKEFHCEYNCLTGKVPQSLPSQVIIDLGFAYNYFSGCIPDFYEGLSVSFEGNYFCQFSAIPCWLSTAELGCGVTSPPRTNVQGTFSFCPGSSCLSEISS